MARYLGIPTFQHDDQPKVGILLTNLGSPDAPTPVAVRRYLKEFLSDPRVVEMSRPLWWLILNLVILNIRPRKSAALYKTIWTEAGSPLILNSQEQADKVRSALENRYPGRTEVALGMRYGNPSIESALETLHNSGVKKLFVLPLYPQYSATTTASTFDAVSGVLKAWRWLPELHFVTHYHDDHNYIQALAASVKEHWQQHGRSEYFVLSFHGLPKRCLTAGDPYHCECHATSRLLAEALELKDSEWQTTFQSRVGREEWLRPYTDETLRGLPAKGIKKIDVICPGFSADCLETLEEIAVTNREEFINVGGEEYRYIPALNASDPHIEMITNLIRQHTQGWPELNDKFDQAAIESMANERCKRALAKGAEK
jgi:ferrochelatase